MTTPTTSRRAAGVAAALFAVALWAGWIPVTRLGVVTRLTPWDVAALRFGISGLLLLPLFLRRYREVPWSRPVPLAGLVAGAGVPYLLAFGSGLRIANSGQGGVLGPGANGAFVAAFALAALGERPGRRRVFGLAITLVGVALVVLHDASQGGVRIGGFALILLASALWAVYTVSSRALALDPLLNAAVVCVVNALLYVPDYLAAGGAARLAAVPAADLALQAVYQGVVTAIVALVAYAFAVERLGPTGAAGFTPLSPVLAAAFGWLMLGDTVDPATGGGLALVAAGVVVASGALARTAAPGR